MRAARIDHGLVADVWEVPNLDCFGPESLLIEAPSWVQVGSSYSPESGFVLSVEQRAAAQAQLVARLTTEIQGRLDAFARTRKYDGILSACTYAASSVPKFQAEGQYCVQARDTTCAAAYTVLADVQAGTRPMPTSIADIEADLPSLGWPA